MSLAATYEPVFYYYHTDHLGSARILTDRSGEMVQHYGYTPFGEEIYKANTSAYPLGYRFTDHFFDEATGLYFFGSRYYDPEIGRFVQPDAFVPDPADSQSLNRYAYVDNNYINAVDPDGFDSVHFTLIYDQGGTATYASSDSPTISITPVTSTAGTVSISVESGLGNPTAGTLERRGIGQPGALLGAVPVIGNVWSAVDYFQTGHPVLGTLHVALAVSDVFLVKAVVTGVIKAGASLLIKESVTVAANEGTTVAGRMAIRGACFPAGTVVATSVGHKSIEEVCAGDQVWSYDEATGEITFRPVVRSFSSTADTLVTIRLTRSEIVTTDEHPFWVFGTGWVAARELEVGARLVALDGSTRLVENVTTNVQERRVYNFEVAESHTYFVGTDPVLVHNMSKIDPSAFNVGKGAGKETVSKGAAERARNIAKGIPPNQLGPSGKPKFHVVTHSSIKKAKDAARSTVGKGGTTVKPPIAKKRQRPFPW